MSLRDLVLGVSAVFALQAMPTYSPKRGIEYNVAYAEGRKPDKELERLIDSLNPAQAEEWNKNKQYQRVIETLRDSLERTREYDLGRLDQERREKLGYVFNEMGCAFISAGSLDEAILNLKRSLSIRPNHPSTVYNLASTYVRQKDMKLAVEYLKKFLELKPEDSRVPKIQEFIRKNS